MANTNNPFGFKAVRYSSGAPYTGGGSLYHLPTGEANDLYIGDPVILAGSADASGVPTITKATAGSGNRLTGFIQGFRPTARIQADGYRVGGTSAYAYVADDPSVVFEGQITTIAAADVGLNCNLVAGTGNRINQSRFSANGATLASGATLQLRVLGLAQREDNEIGAYAKVYVRINLPTEAGIASGVGV